MRLTLTIDDDLAPRLNDISRWRGIPFEQAVNDTIRTGLDGRPVASDSSRRPTTWASSGPT